MTEDTKAVLEDQGVFDRDGTDLTDTEVADGQRLFDREGKPLLFKEDVARLRGVQPATITHHGTTAQRRRRSGGEARFPAPYAHVRRVKLKTDGQPVVSLTPVWREEDALRWVENPLGPGGRPLAADEDDGPASRAS